jgi:tyrosyl-tRNA synthetase
LPANSPPRAPSPTGPSARSPDGWSNSITGRIYHGADAAKAAAERFDLIHRQHGVPEDVELVAVTAEDPSLAIEDGRIWIARLIVRAGLAPSTSQASRLIEQGAISVDGQRVEDRAASVTASGEYLIQKGKRHFRRIRFDAA